MDLDVAQADDADDRNGIGLPDVPVADGFMESAVEPSGLQGPDPTAQRLVNDGLLVVSFA